LSESDCDATNPGPARSFGIAAENSDDIERFADKPIDSATYPIKGTKCPNPASALVALIFTDRFVDDIARRTATDSQSFDVPKLFKNIDPNPRIIFPNRDPISGAC
jgi:hypothetical protein